MVTGLDASKQFDIRTAPITVTESPPESHKNKAFINAGPTNIHCLLADGELVS